MFMSLNAIKSLKKIIVLIEGEEKIFVTLLETPATELPYHAFYANAFSMLNRSDELEINMHPFVRTGVKHTMLKLLKD